MRKHGFINMKRFHCVFEHCTLGAGCHPVGLSAYTEFFCWNVFPYVPGTRHNFRHVPSGGQYALIRA